MNIEFDVTLLCNFSCLNCNRHSNFNDLSSPLTGGKSNKVGLNYYENTDITIEQTKKFIEEVKENGTVERIHLIGGEPLVHPQMDKICDLMREELWGKYVREILIISNLHPKMLKKGTLDSPEQIVKYAPDLSLDIAYEHSSQITAMALSVVREILYHYSDDYNKENLMDYADQIIAGPFEGKDAEGRTAVLDELPLKDLLEFKSVYLFHGIPVINYKPLSAKHEEHRCSLVAPIDTGQEMIDECDHPRGCGQNYAWDGYYPCANGAAIARLFKLDKYRRDTLPKNESDWDGIDENGIAHTKSKGMYDLCKLCQVAAKNQLWERDHGRPISVSYRKALGLEGNTKTTEYVVEGHKKKLAPNPGFTE